MLTEDGLDGLMREIMSQSIDEETASDYAVLIGDTPGMDEARTCVIVRHGNKVIARLKPLKFFNMI